MNKEKLKNKRFFTLLAIFFAFVLSAICILPAGVTAFATAEENISTQADVDVNDVFTRYQEYSSSDIISNIPSNVAYCDSTLTNDGNNNTLSNGSFHWTNGANVMNNDIGKLVFTLNMDTSDYDYCSSTKLTDKYFVNLYRASKDTNSSEQLLSITWSIIEIDSLVYQLTMGSYIEQSTFGSESIGFGDLVANSSNSDNGLFYLKNYTKKSSVPSSAKYFPFYGDTDKQLHIVIDTEYLTDTYFLSFGKYDDNNETNRIDSKIVSVYDIVKQMQERDELSYLDEDQQTRATELLNDGTIKKIQVSWLEEIEGTPFATKHYGWVEIPVVSNMISPSDVATALGKESFAVGSSMCQYFQEDTATGIFNAYYLKNIWLSSKDANGNSMNLFLDINKSYRDYYYPFLRDEIFTQGMYEWFWSTMITKYPQISNVDDSELYGYFGYTSVPYTYTLSQLVYEMFDGSPNMDGVVQYYSYRDNLSYESYIKLLDDYGYGWLSKAWNTVADFVAGCNYPADHYFFYCDGTQDNVFIGENGAEDINDNKSSFIHGVENVFESIGSLFDSTTIRWFAIVLGIILVLWIIVSLFSKLFSNNNSHYKKSSKRKRKK